MPTSITPTESVELALQKIEATSPVFAERATALSEFIERIDSRLKSLPGKTGAHVEVDNMTVSFGRVKEDWGLWLHDGEKNEWGQQTLSDLTKVSAINLCAFPDISAYGDRPEDFADAANAIARAIQAAGFSSIAEAKAIKSQIVQAQKLLRLVKKGITAKVRAINADFQNERIRVGKSVGSVIARGFFGGRAVGSYNQVTRANLRMQQMQAVAPYEGLKTQIDTMLIQMDRNKLTIENWISSQR
jgi:hypothetical protein